MTACMKRRTVGHRQPPRHRLRYRRRPAVAHGGKRRLSCTMQALSNGRAHRSIREHPPHTNPVAAAAGLGETTGVGLIGYVARRGGYDAAECIRKAAEDGKAVFRKPSGDGHREYDVYRLTAKGAGRPKGTFGSCSEGRKACRDAAQIHGPALKASRDRRPLRGGRPGRGQHRLQRRPHGGARRSEPQ